MAKYISKETHDKYECNNCGDEVGTDTPCILFISKACAAPYICTHNSPHGANWKRVVE